MLESVVARIVNNLLGKYVEELDTEGLNVGIFSGKVSLRNLKLKPSCLYELQLPIEVGCGIIGELRFVIPWNSFAVKPIHFELENLLIVAHPLGLLPYDSERDRELRRSTTKRLLYQIENDGASFIQGLLNAVLPLLGHTVQLHVHNLHIRYEDAAAGVAVGLLVQEFSVETTNSKWKPVSHNSGGSVYQLLRLEAFSVYVNTGLPRSHLVIGDDAWVLQMRTALEQFQLKGSPLNLVVKPVNAKLKVIVGDNAPLLVDIVVQDVVIVLTDTQLSALRHILQYLHRIQFYRKYLAKRPNKSVKGHCSEWWKYLMIAVLEQRVLPYTWSRFSLLRKSYHDYKNLYKQCILHPGDTELKLDLQHIEDNLPLFCVVIAREHAKSEIFATGAENVGLSDKPGRYRLHVRSLSKEVEEPQFIEFKLNVTVDNVSMSLVRDGREVLCAGLAGCVCSFEARRDDAWRASARLASVLIEGNSSDSELVTLLSSSTPAGSQTGHGSVSCFSMDIEQKPWTSADAAKYGLSIAVTPMEIIYQEHAFSEILCWLDDVELNNLLKFDKSVVCSSNWWLFLDLHASVALPRIIIPESGSIQKSGMVLIVDPGKWSVETELQSQLTVEEFAEMTQMELEERLHHRYQLQWSDLQILLTDSGEEWRDLAVRDESIGHVLSRMSGSLTVSISTKQEYRLLPQLKLNLAVPFVHGCVSERRIEHLHQLINNVPIPRIAGRMFSPAPILWPEDRIKPEPSVKDFVNLTQNIVITQLRGQGAADVATNHAQLKGILAGSFVNIEKIGSEASDEDLELWARAVDRPGFEDNVSPNNSITVLLRVTIKEFVLNLPKCVEFQERPYLMIRVGYISMDVALMEYGPAVQLAVRAFQLIDKQHISANGEYLEMVSTHSDQDFFSLLYRKVFADCPDFKTHFHAVEESLVVDLGTLSFLLRRDAYQNMFFFLRRISNLVTDKPLIPFAMNQWLKLTKSVKLLESRDVPVPPGGIKFSYSMHVTKLHARLRESDVDMLDISVRGLGGDWFLRANDRLILRLHLQGLAIDDLSETTLYPQIVSQDEDEVFELKFIRLNAGAERRNVAQGKIKFTLGRLHVLFANHVLQTFRRFGTLFYNEVIKTAGDLIRNWAENSWLDEYRNCQRAWHLSLDLHLPVVLLPPGATAPSLFIVNFGNLTVENFIKEDASGHVVDNILVRMENTFITRGLMKLTGDVESREEFLEHLKLQIDVKRSLTGVTGVDIVSSVDNVRVCMGQKDFALVLNLLAANHSITHILDLWESRSGSDPFELRNLQVFLRDGNARRRDLSFRFTLDSFTMMLFIDMDEQLSSPVRDVSHALCKLQIDDLVTHIETQATGLSELRLSIKNITVDDVRTDTAVLIHRIFGPRFRDANQDSAISVSFPPLVDVVGKENERGDRCFDILVEKTRLSLTIGFIAALAKFIDDAVPSLRDDFGGCDNLGYVADATPNKSKKETLRCLDHLHDVSNTAHKGLSLSLQLKRPELAIVAAVNRSAEETVGFVTKCEIFLDWSSSPGREELVVRFSDLRLTTIQPAPMVMQPCDLQLVRNSTAAVGVRMTADVSPVYLTFGSGAFAAITAIFDEFEVLFPKRRESIAAPFAQLIEFDDLWCQRKIEAGSESVLNFSNTDPGHCTPHSFPVATPAESVTMHVGKLTTVIGLETGNRYQPLFVGKSSLKLQAQDWNSSIVLNSEIQMEIACWNETIEIWEPVLQPWTILCRMYQSCALPISPSAVRSTRSLTSRTASPPAVHRTADCETETDSDSEEADPTMTFIKPEQFNLCSDANRPNDGFSCGSDLEIDDGVIGRLHSGIVHLFVKEDESSDGEDETSDDVETESATSDTRSPRFSPTERAVFLNKHADSIDSGLEAEAVDRQAVHVLIHAVSSLRVIISPNMLKLIDKLRAPNHFSPTAKRVVNYLGPGSVVQLLRQDSVLGVCKFDHDSGTSTPEMTPPTSPSHFHSPDSHVGDFENGRISPDLSFPRESLDKLSERVRGLRLKIEIPGFDTVVIPVGQITGKKDVKLTPMRSGVQCMAIVDTSLVGDGFQYTVSSPFKIHNSTLYPMGVYYKKSSLLNIGESVIGECANPFEEATRLAVIAPDDTFHIPLTVCHHAQVYFLPIHLTNYSLSLDGISWAGVKTNSEAIYDYVYSDPGGSLFSFKVGWKTDGVVCLTPPLLVRNVLPCACEIKLPDGQTLRLEAGEETHVYSVDLRMQLQLTMLVPDYIGLTWQAGFQIGPDSKEKLVVMNADQDTDGGNKQLAINIQVVRSQTDVLLLYEPYWLLNRTGLALLIRGSGSHVIQEWSDGKPLLFTYRRPRSRTVRLRVLTSSWSPAFSLDAVGCSGLIVCRDRERNKKFFVIMECSPCHVEPTLCRTITFLPYITVENGSRKHLRFMEDNEKADLWLDINPGQTVPFWPDTETMQMVVRLRDSKNSSVPFPISSPHVTALRIDKGYSLTVEVTGGDLKPLRVLLRPYRSGDAPVRIDNLCVDLFLRLRQKDCPQVALLSPNHSLLYTWDDPCKDRNLLWSIYNNAGQELSAHWQNDGYGEERITFRSVTANSPESSDTSDDDPSLTNDPSVSKRIRKDTIVVYWSSFLQAGQRVLLITEDERLARKARRFVEAERSSIELFCALYSCSISLLNYDQNNVLREVAHLTVNSSAAQWELNVGERCKTLTADVASWLETNYVSNVAQPKINDLIQADFGKMQMIRPLFGSLRRRQRAALWFQYRSSHHLSVVQMHIYRLQLDDQRVNTNVPCVFYASPSAGDHPALEGTLLWRHGVNEENSVKFTSMSLQDHVVNLDSDWLLEVCDVASNLCILQDTQSKMRDDITRLHAQSLTHVLQVLEEASQAFVEQLHFGSFNLNITVWPSNMCNGKKLSFPVPDVFAGFVSAIRVMPAPISGITVKFREFQLKQERFSVERVISHYRTQLLQQLHVLVLGLNVLAAPSAKKEITGQPRKETVMFPEEFSKALSLEAETKMAARLIVDNVPLMPDSLHPASNAFPLGCVLAVEGLGIGSSRGNNCTGWEAFRRGAGRSVIALLAALDSEPKSTLPNPLYLLMDQINRYGKSILCRSRAPLTINSMLGVRPFSMIESQGAALLYGLSRGRYNCEIYWSHAPLTANHSMCLIITLERLLLAEQVGKSNVFDTTWTCLLGLIQNITISDSGMIITTLSGTDVTEREIPCWDTQVLNHVYERVKEVIHVTLNTEFSNVLA